MTQGQKINIPLQRRSRSIDPDKVQTQFVSLVRHLHRGGQFGHIWLAKSNSANPKKVSHVKTEWWQTSNETPPLTPQGQSMLNVYFGVNPTIEIPTADAKGNPKSPDNVRSRKDIIAAVNCLFADMDKKDFASGNAFAGHIQALEPPPSVVVATGGGYHLYWLLNEPVLTPDEGSRAEMSTLLRRWVDHLKADTAAADLTRVLRVPGSTNWKHPEQPQVEFLKCDMSAVYSLDELKSYLPDPVEKARSAGSYQIANLDKEIQKAQAALDLLKPERADDREEWVRVGMSLSQLGEAGFDLWDKWSQQSKKYDADDAVSKWESWRSADDMDSDAVTLKTLYHIAREDAAEITEDDLDSLIALVDESSDTRKSASQKLALRRDIAERLTWYPDDVVSIVREHAAGTGWTRRDFDKSMAAAVKNGAGVKETDGDNEQTDSLVLGLRWLGLYPETATVNKEWFRFHEGIWVPHPDRKVVREVSEIGIDQGMKVERGKVEAAIYFGEAFTERAWEPTDWDPEPTLLIVENGALDISVWPPKLLPWSSEYQNRVKLPVVYNPTARCPLYKKVLIENLDSTGNAAEAKAVARFLMQFAGLALAELTGYHDLGVWMYGPGGGGKSTVLKGISAVFGEYAAIVNVSSLDSNRFGLEPVLYKKLIYANESDISFLENPGVINEIVSQDTISVEPKYKPAFQYKSRAAVLFAMNELPGSANPESGIFRRIQIVEVPGRDVQVRDPSIRHAIEHDEDERSGILNFMLQGMHEVVTTGKLIKQGMIPQSVYNRTEQWVFECDKTRVFTVSDCERGSGYKVSLDELYKAYQRWCRVSGLGAVGKTKFNKDMRRLGYESYKTGGLMHWKDLRLTPAASQKSTAISISRTP